MEEHPTTFEESARLGASFPLEAVGLVGDDENGRTILADCHAHHIDIRQCDDLVAATTNTDVMTVEGTGRATFFHQRGAMPTWMSNISISARRRPGSSILVISSCWIS